MHVAFLEQAQELIAEFRRRLDEPFFFWTVIIVGALPLLIMLVWPSKPAAAPAAAAATAPSASPASPAAPVGMSPPMSRPLANSS